MKGPLFYSKILLFGEYGIIKDSKGLSIPYNFYNGALIMEKAMMIQPANPTRAYVSLRIILIHFKMSSLI